MKEPFIFLCSEITLDHASTLIKWMEDKEVTRYLSDSPNIAQSLEQALNRINLPVLTHLFNHEGRFYMAFDKHKVPVGFVRLIKKGENYEIVIAIGDRHKWGKKLGTNTILESMKIAFFEFRAKKLTAKIHKENIRSIKAFINAGFSIEDETAHYKIFTITMNDYLKSVKRRAIMTEEIFITQIDLERLKKVIDAEPTNGPVIDQAIQSLRHEMNRATVVASPHIPQDVVTMNSRALLRLDDEDLEISLVYPKDADRRANRISVCSPVGTAILGYREGTTIEWKVPSGTTTIHIKKILYQPEAAGDYHL